MLSPRMWGWTEGREVHRHAGGVVPTYVGVDRPAPSKLVARHRCPHVCGGGPGEVDPFSANGSLSPRMWGWTGNGNLLMRIVIVVPTYVGVDRSAIARGRTAFGCPHVCGGGPFKAPASMPELWLSPRMWGWTGDYIMLYSSNDVVPTYVGVDRWCALRSSSSSCCPHVCGGGPATCRAKLVLPMLSPRMWGWTVTVRYSRTVQVVVPTYVGVDRVDPISGFGSASCPHVCGGGPTCSSGSATPPSLSPRMWGWTAAKIPAAIADIVVPMYVGVDRKPG